jgi:hypothetical protein
MDALPFFLKKDADFINLAIGVPVDIVAWLRVDKKKLFSDQDFIVGIQDRLYEGRIGSPNISRGLKAYLFGQIGLAYLRSGEAKVSFSSSAKILSSEWEFRGEPSGVVVKGFCERGTVARYTLKQVGGARADFKTVDGMENEASGLLCAAAYSDEFLLAILLIELLLAPNVRHSL